MKQGTLSSCNSHVESYDKLFLFCFPRKKMHLIKCFIHYNKHLHWLCQMDGKLSSWLCTDKITFPKFLQSYQQVFNQVIGTDGLEIEMKDKRFVRLKSDLPNFHPLLMPATLLTTEMFKCAEGNWWLVSFRPKSLCFNCGLSGHQLRDCPKVRTRRTLTCCRVQRQHFVITSTFLLDTS